MARPRFGIVDAIGAVTDAWHRSWLGQAITSRLEDIADRWRSGRLKARLKAFGDEVTFQWPVFIQAPEDVELGNHVSFAAYTHVWGSGGVRIGDHVMVSTHVSIVSITHDYRAPLMWGTIVKKPVVIGSDVWIGTHVVIMPGVTIGDGAVLGAGSMVTHDVPANAIVVGVPARVVGHRPVAAIANARSPS